MDLKKLAPWNWFKNEEESEAAVPVQHAAHQGAQVQLTDPVSRLHREMDQLFNNFFQGFGLLPSYRPGEMFSQAMADSILKPTLDIGADNKEYTISIEVPGVEQKDIALELADNILTIRGEKKQEKEEKEKDYYRMERSYGSFQRVLTLPEDADKDKLAARFKNGVLSITMPRKELPRADIKQIEIQ